MVRILSRGEGESKLTVTGSTVQDQELMAEGKQFSLQGEARAEAITYTREQTRHGSEGYRTELGKCSDFNLFEVFGRDRSPWSSAL